MTDLLHDVDAPSDAELISRVRGGDVAAYGDLFARHVDAAKRLARQLVRGPDADDLVSDAFAKVLSVLQGGGGPDVAFRAYLLTAVRRLHVDKVRSGARLQTSDDMEAFDAGVPFQDTAVAAFESGAAAKAFASLPERWQLVLWHLEVEGQKPADIAPLLGMSPNSVSALAYRAREGLRQAFLTMHLNDISETDCRWVNEHLGAYVRNGLAKRDSVKVRAHLDDCRRCTAMYLELTEVNSNLAGIIAPLLLGAAATGYLASAGGAAGGFGLSAAFGRVRDLVSANAGVATAGAVAAGVAAVATAGIMLLPSSSPDTVAGADRPAQTVSTPPAAGGSDEPAGDKRPTQKPSGEPSVGGPVALLPSELPSPSDSPAAIAVLDPGTTTTGDGTTTGGGTGDGTAPGGTTNPPGDQTSTPTDPTEPAPTEPTEPAPTEPTEPAPTEPAPTEPTEPAPTQPAPTQPTEPAPTETTAPPPPTEPPPVVTYTLTVGPATISNNEVSFDVTGTPELPPTVYLKIESDPAGIEFSDGGTCQVRAGDTTVAVCDTAPAAAVTSLARTVLAASDASFPVTMPLSGSPTKTTEVTITLSAPEDNVLQTVKTQYVVDTPPTTADVSLAGLPEQVEADAVHDYSFSGTVAGVPAGYDGKATFTLGSEGNRATFVKTDGCAVSGDGLTLTCDSIANGTVPFLVYVKDNSVDTPVDITLAALDGLADDDTKNNTASTTLAAVRPADAKVTAADAPQGNSGQGAVTASVTVSPDLTVGLRAGYDPDQVQVTPPADCDEVTPGRIQCTVDGAADLPFDYVLKDRAGNETRVATLSFSVTVPAEYADSDPENDSASVTVERFEQDSSTSTTTDSSSLLRTASDGASAGSGLVDQRAGSTSEPSATLRKSATEVDLLPGARTSSAKKADAPAKKHHAKKQADRAQPDKGKHKAAGHDRKPDKPAKDHAAKKGDEPAKAQGQGDHGSDHSNDHSNGSGSGNEGDHGRKDDPGPVQRVVSAAADLLL